MNFRGMLNRSNSGKVGESISAEEMDTVCTDAVATRQSNNQILLKAQLQISRRLRDAPAAGYAQV